MALEKISGSDFGLRLAQLGDVPALILFTSPTCAPCTKVKKILEPLEQVVLEVDISTDLEIAQRYLVNAVPTLVLDTIEDTRSRVVGTNFTDIMDLVLEYRLQLEEEEQ